MVGLIHGISCYTLLESTLTIPHFVQSVKEAGYDALAIADKNNLYAWPQLYHCCQAEGIKPLAAMKLAYKSRIDDEIYYLLLVAKDNIGLTQLYALTKEASHPRYIDEYDALDAEHLFFITPGYEGELEHFVSAQQYDEAKTALAMLQRATQHTLYMSLASQDGEEEVERWLMFQQLTQVPLVASDAIAATCEHDLFLNKVLYSIQHDEPINKVPDQRKVWLQEATTFETYYQINQPKALRHLNEIIEQCHVTLEEHQSLLPQFPVPNHTDAKSYLYEQCQRGKERIAQWTEEYENRLIEELTVIHEMGFDDYFLMIWDVLQEARRRHILTSPGRGSVAGSLVAYVLYITDIDPLEYNLLFERFLNQDRQTMPDIDLDFPDYRRDELYHYLMDKYGNDHVARIITFGTMAARQVIKDVTKAFGLSASEQQEWTKAVYIQAHDVKITLKQAYHDSYTLRKLVNYSEENKQLFKTALELEGLPKTIGMHAAGVVVTSEPLNDYVPLQYNDSWLLTQWTMTEVERVGLLKMDFLGLKNLTIIQQTLQYIQQYYGKTIDIHHIPLNDERVFEAFSKADTVGIFQFESKGMKQLLKKIKPKNLEDLSLINAIHRPGPSLNSDEVVARRFGHRPITYIDPSVEPILQATYGLMIYQEQVMQVAQVFAGYTLNEADNLRRAMGKKSMDIMQQEKEPFITRSIQNGRDPHIAQKLFDDIMAFAGYGFNKSHSIAYSLFSYRMMYLKVHYPAAFYLSLLKETSPRTKSFITYIRELQQKNIHVLPPTVNQSQSDYFIDHHRIIMGLTMIKGIDTTVADYIVDERKCHGRYTSVDNFIERLPIDYRKKTILIPLIEAGCFDAFNSNRRYLIENLDALIINANYAYDERLKDVFKTDFERYAPYSLETQLKKEKDRIGAYIATRPMEKIKPLEQALSTQGLNQDNEYIRSFVMVNDMREVQTKQKATMALLEIEDSHYHVEDAVIFASYYRHVSVKVGDIILIEGVLKDGKYGKQVVIESLTPYDTLYRALEQQKLYLRLNHDELYKQQQLLQLFHQNKGMTPVVIVFSDTKERRLLNEHYWITPNTNFLNKVKAIIGGNNMKMYDS